MPARKKFMSVIYNQTSRTFKLDTPNTSYVIEIGDGEYIFHRYYGAKIPDTDLSYLDFNKDYGSFFPKSPDTGIQLDAQLLEYPTYGIGDYRTSALMIRGADGTATTDIRYSAHRIYKGKPALDGLPSTYADESEAETLEIDALDSHTGALVTLVYTAFENHDAITKSVMVKNTGNAAFTLERVFSGALDMPSCDYDCINLWGHWGKERTPERVTLHHGKQSVESTRVSSSHNHNPFMAIVSKNADEDLGEAYGFNLVYSGSFLIETEVDHLCSSRVVAGINPIDFEWTLAPGESFTTPELVCVYSNRGIGEMSRIFHKLYINNLCRRQWKGRKRPILVNNWEGTYFDFDDEKLLAIAKDAADLGIEMLVLDDGWFGADRNIDIGYLGDWTVNEKKIRCGMKELVRRVHSLGLKFGLWFEPEMISPIGKLYEAHPDWCLHVDGRKLSPARNQYVLDYSRKDVRDYIVDIMSNLIADAGIEYVKWDFNRNMTELGSALLPPEKQKELCHRYVLGLYEVMSRLLEKFPDLLIEGCSGGGGRFDAGILYYAPQIWTSDDTDAIERIDIQYGTSYVYPAAAMSAHLSASPNHQTGRSTGFETRGIVAMGGNFGYELDVTKFTEEEREMVRRQIKDYNKYQALVQNGELYRLISPYKNRMYSAWEYVADDKSEALLTFAVMRREIYTRYYLIKLRGLDAGKRYLSSRDGKVYSGALLMNSGVNLEGNYSDGDSLIIHFTEVK